MVCVRWACVYVISSFTHLSNLINFNVLLHFQAEFSCTFIIACVCAYVNAAMWYFIIVIIISAIRFGWIWINNHEIRRISSHRAHFNFLLSGFVFCHWPHIICRYGIYANAFDYLFLPCHLKRFIDIASCCTPDSYLVLLSESKFLWHEKWSQT